MSTVRLHELAHEICNGFGEALYLACIRTARKRKLCRISPNNKGPSRTFSREGSSFPHIRFGCDRAGVYHPPAKIRAFRKINSESIRRCKHKCNNQAPTNSRRSICLLARPFKHEVYRTPGYQSNS
ncbi:hypothetical protein BLNAU_22354 [Blattamonas nauphoetae]|uniref:Uncharacterized protein n=1 Tax=Blattamonas nauphoetae TaxID=2049346 RepID=A0ABQ9WPU0_9EUKA|nr:hypothetical protein BLNAU_23592 [Blattamonas nauphoetae]KAK2942736.1 hypothetical protein BLNAU_22354 [Blattamonas nauphoetae]